MTDPSIFVLQEPELPRLPTYVGVCCREWTLAVGVPVGSCGLCGERPKRKEPEE